MKKEIMRDENEFVSIFF